MMAQERLYETLSDEALAEFRNRYAISRPDNSYQKRRSKLERHAGSILKLRDSGATFQEIQFYLQHVAKPAVTAQQSTIMRFIRNLEERGRLG